MLSDSRQDIFSPPQLPRLDLRPTQPPIKWVPGALSQVGKQAGNDVHHCVRCEVFTEVNVRNAGILSS
jgi:hypothetical protein